MRTRIYIGLDDDAKSSVVERYREEHDIRKVVVLFPEKFEPPFCFEDDRVTYAGAIMYKYFYRLLQEIDESTLIVLNEFLRTQNRYDLTYNCVRHYLQQTPHSLVFQMFPQIDDRDDFMILFDFVTQSRWKSRKFDLNLILDTVSVEAQPHAIQFNRVDVRTSEKTKRRYAKERKRRFEEIGARDPHTIPRNLYLIGGRDKRDYIDKQSLPLFADLGLCVARNQRLSRDNIVSYRTLEPDQRPSTVVEFPHRFIEFADFMTASRRTHFDVLCADLKVDDWYFQRYTEWSERIHETCASLQE
jgi:hypothetical protein